MKKVFVFASCALFFVACKKEISSKGMDDFNLTAKSSNSNDNSNNNTGYIYTSTNETSGNAVIALARHRDGSVTEIGKSPYLTGDAGDAAEGDFDTQWSLRLLGEYLLVVNAGANPVNGSISVFKVNKRMDTSNRLIKIQLHQKWTTWIPVGLELLQ
jgi:hypothetical protein